MKRDPMTVGELIAALQKLPQDLPVMIAQDAEGNGFNYLAEDFGEYWFNTEDKEMIGAEDELTGSDRKNPVVKKVLCLWP